MKKLLFFESKIVILGSKKAVWGTKNTAFVGDIGQSSSTSIVSDHRKTVFPTHHRPSYM